MGQSIRTFIAIELSPENQNRLARIQDELKKTAADVKWVGSGNIHLTVKFLGDVNQDRIPWVVAALREGLTAVEDFRFQCDHLGAFPKTENPRIIWAGITEGAEQTAALAKVIEGKLETLNFLKDDRPFTAHITLGRMRGPLNRLKLSQAIQDCSFAPPIEQNVGAITLFQSRLTASGPNYVVLERIELRK